MIICRRVLGLSLVSLLFASATGHAQSQRADRLSQFDNLLSEVDTSVSAPTHSYRELEFRERGPSEAALNAQPRLQRKFSSAKKISDRARLLIIQFEVSSEAVYQKLYQNPTWPGGNSGITIGIGYDLGYVDQHSFREDWKDFVDPKIIESLVPLCTRHDPSVGKQVGFLTDVKISWEAALKQFDSNIIQVAGEVVSEIPGSDALSADSFGALVSLVYNRGSASYSSKSDPMDTRREIREIKAAVKSGDLSNVSADIVHMTRIWENNDKLRKGMTLRRKLEAELFEAGR